MSTKYFSFAMGACSERRVMKVSDFVDAFLGGQSVAPRKYVSYIVAIFTLPTVYSPGQSIFYMICMYF